METDMEILAFLEQNTFHIVSISLRLWRPIYGIPYIKEP